MAARTLTPARAIALLGACALAVAGCGASPTHTSARVQCPVKALHAKPGPSVSAPTDQLLIVFVLQNVTSDACSVEAAPRITLYSGQGSKLPFAYRAPASANRRLTIGAHRHVYLVMTKHPCTLHAAATAMSLGLGLAHGKALHLRLPSPGGFDYCGAKDPSGHVVHVLPLGRALKTLLTGT